MEVNGQENKMDLDEFTKDEEDAEMKDTEEENDKPEDVTGDGGVIKKILRKGDGWKTPEKGYEVEVHYVGKLDDGTVFDSSRERGDTFKFKLGNGGVIKGWDKGVKTMKKNELAILTCKPEYAYGEAGSPPKIPPKATLHFEVELINWVEESDVSTQKDGGILKKVLKEGEGWEKPSDDTRVKVNYKLFVVEGEESFRQVDEKRDFEFITGAEEVPAGLDQAVLSMKKGEQGYITVLPKYGYGSEGNASLNIPPDAKLRYEFELVDWEKEKNSWEMSKEEKIEAASKCKREGNDLYSGQKYKRAIKKYKKAMNYLPDYEINKLPAEEYAKATKEVLIPAHLNAAACYLKTREFKEAKDECEKVLKLDADNLKALFRRACVLMEFDDWDLARSDLERALEIDPENKEVKRQMTILNKKEAAQNKKDKKIFGGMFDRFAKEDEEKEKKRVEREKLEDQKRREKAEKPTEEKPTESVTA